MKKEYNFLLWDIDDTLIDFKASEKIALRKCFEAHNVILSDDDVDVYSKINQNYWKLLEQEQIEKDAMLVRRFQDFIEYLGAFSINGSEINKKFQVLVGDYAVLYDDAYEICQHFQGIKKQYAITNGTIVAQENKLKTTGLGKLFDDVFISDKVGHQKPSIDYFRYVCEHIPNFKINEALIIGDSLSSDMKGANKIGIDCCWFNPKNAEIANSNVKIDYEIKELKEIFDIIK